MEQETKDRIVQQASELFRRYGVRSVAMDDIASHLSMSKKTLYQYFQDKKEIVSVCTDYMMHRDFAEMESLTQNACNVIEELLLLSEHLKRMLTNMNPSLLFDLKKYHPEAWQVYEQQKHLCFFNKLLEAIARGKSEGLFRPELDAEVLARMRMEQVEMGFNPILFPSDKFDLAHVQLQMFWNFTYGLVTLKGHQVLSEMRA